MTKNNHNIQRKKNIQTVKNKKYTLLDTTNFMILNTSQLQPRDGAPPDCDSKLLANGTPLIATALMYRH